ncbi:MAG: trypsin-like peptidase domain-containing protein [Myxococcales bacterium]|nr:trypsin-like peptidase domain-containing protein [Myxococcales bacterium]
MRPDSVVRIFVTTQEPDYDNPWQASSPSRGTGSGVVIGPRRVLTGAHVVADATFIRAQTTTSPDKFTARLVGICHDADLALLEVDDPAFMDGVEIAELGELPSRGDKVSVVGFPVGGEEISVTEGVVSRIEIQRYSHSDRTLLAVTVDAAINSGNSGGPVFLDGRVAGVAFQSLDDAENVGEMVPVSLVRRFLSGVDQDRPLAIPGLGFLGQTLENPTLRASLGMGPSDSGVLVRSVAYGGSVHGRVRSGDVLMEIDGYPIANNGTIQYLGQHRTGYVVVLGDHYVGDELSLVLLRGGERHELEITLGEPTPLVAHSQYDVDPRYFVYGGLVFQPLSMNFLATWDRWWNHAPKEFLYHFHFGIPTEDRREVVALTQVLADEVNVGYESRYCESVVAVDGHKPRDLEDFVRRVEAAEGILRLEMSSGCSVVLDVAAVRAAQPRVLERYRIPRDRSERLSAGPVAVPEP